MELYLMLCASLDGKKVWGRMETCICMAKSLCCSHENITLLFVNQLQPNKKLKKNEDIRQAGKKNKAKFQKSLLIKHACSVTQSCRTLCNPMDDCSHSWRHQYTTFKIKKPRSRHKIEKEIEDLNNRHHKSNRPNRHVRNTPPKNRIHLFLKFTYNILKHSWLSHKKSQQLLKAWNHTNGILRAERKGSRSQ